MSSSSGYRYQIHSSSIFISAAAAAAADWRACVGLLDLRQSTGPDILPRCEDSSFEVQVQSGREASAPPGESTSLLQQQQQQQVVLQDTYHESRSEALQNVESTIVELGGIFQQLAHMVPPPPPRPRAHACCVTHVDLPVQCWPGTHASLLHGHVIVDNQLFHRIVRLALVLIKCSLWSGIGELQVHEQGEMAVRIDENLGDSVANVDSAQAQLLKYLNTVSSNRWLIMKILGVLMFFSMIFLFIT